MIKGRGLNCHLIICKYPLGAPVTDRAIPVAIFSAEPSVKRYFLRKWFKDPAFDCTDFRDAVDWQYYKERLGKSIQKIITIPAGMQLVHNPCPRVEHPVWLQRRFEEAANRFKQKKITSMFAAMTKKPGSGSGEKDALVAPTSIALRKVSGGSSAVGGVVYGASEVASAAGTGAVGVTSTVSLILSPAGKKRGPIAGSVSSTPPKGASPSPSDRKRALFGSPGSGSGGGDVSGSQDHFNTEADSGRATLAAMLDIEDLAGEGVGADRRGTGGVPVAHFRGRRVHFTPPSSPIHSVDEFEKMDGADEMEEGGDDLADVVDMDEVGDDTGRGEFSTGSDFGDSHDKSPKSSESVDLTTKLTPESSAVVAAHKALLVGELETASDFHSWLSTRKESWKVKRASRKMERIGAAGLSRRYTNNPLASSVWGEQGGETGVDGSQRKKAFGVADFVRNAELARLHGHWQIIELQETDTPGEFVAWAMTGKTQLQKLKVVVPRELFVNCLGPEAVQLIRGLSGTLDKRDLPHARACCQLYRVSIPERKFLRSEKSVSFLLSHPQVEGVYETQTPLWLRAILRTGCVSRLTRGADVGKDNAYRVQDLESVSVSRYPYLQPTVALFRRIFLYCVVDKSRNRGFAGLGLFIIDGTNEDDEKEDFIMPADRLFSGRAHFWLANGGNNLDSRPPLQRIYRKYQPDDSASVKFTTTFTTSPQDAFRACNETLNGYLRERHGPTLVIAQGTFEPRRWRKNIPALLDFPIACMPANSLDDMFPALGWQIFVAERMVQRFLMVPRWFHDRLQCSRYADIPLCKL